MSEELLNNILIIIMFLSFTGVLCFGVLKMIIETEKEEKAYYKK